MLLRLLLRLVAGITIEMSEEGDGYRAEVRGKPHLYGYGLTWLHAIGDLVVQFPAVFGVRAVVRKERR